MLAADAYLGLLWLAVVYGLVLYVTEWVKLRR